MFILQVNFVKYSFKLIKFILYKFLHCMNTKNKFEIYIVNVQKLNNYFDWLLNDIYLLSFIYVSKHFQ